MDELSFNAERYADPTVYRALKNLEREERKRRAEECRRRRKGNPPGRKKRRKAWEIVK